MLRCCFQKMTHELNYPTSLHESVVVASPDNFLLLSKQILSKVYPNHLPPELRFQASQQLKQFFQFLYGKPDVQSVAAVDRRESYVNSILDVFVLWGRPLNLFADGEEMRDINERYRRRT